MASLPGATPPPGPPRSNYNYLHTANPWRRFDYTAAGNGAARQIYLARHSKRKPGRTSRATSDDNRSGLQVRLQCTRNGSPTGQACTGPTCEGQLAVKVGYSSRVYEDVTATGIWSKCRAS